MHQSSFDLMGILMKKVPRFSRVLDIGSGIANTGLQRSYRDHIPGGVEYVGFDEEDGRNVDVVGDVYELKDYDGARPDLIISGQVIEHLEAPLLAVQMMKSLLAIDGWIILIAPWQYGIHRYPLDCWRVLPDGMAHLLEGFEDVDVGIRENDCYGVGRKPEGYRSPWIIFRS